MYHKSGEAAREEEGHVRVGPVIIVEVKRKRQNHFLIFENDLSKLRILVYSRLGNQRIWPLVVTATINRNKKNS